MRTVVPCPYSTCCFVLLYMYAAADEYYPATEGFNACAALLRSFNYKVMA